jgi:pimeloyl-ACP methyl ester carboxylesterase
MSIAGCASTSNTPEPPKPVPPATREDAPAAPRPRFSPLAIKLVGGGTLDAELGRISVPENRRKPGSRSIEIAFARLGSTAARPGPPTIYLEGGPGIPAIMMLSHVESWQRFLLALRAAGDVIVIDQRGIGHSRPDLVCPPSERPGDALEGERLYELAVRDARACARHWRDRGVDLSGYNTEQNADDVDAVRAAIGADRVNLVGFSYGTHLTLATIRRHKRHVARAVIMGPAGPDNLRKLPSVVQAQLRRISDLAAKDPAVAVKVPDLVALMKRVLARAAKRPIALEATDGKTRRKFKLKVGRLALEVIAFADFGDTHDLPGWPRLFHAIESGDHRQLVRLVEKRFLRGAPGHAMPAVMRLASGVSAARAARIKRELPGCVLSRGLDFPFQSAEFRAAWDVPDLGDAFRAPVRSEVPLLVYTGTLDGNAPPGRGAAIKAGFPRGAHVVVENAGHEDFHSTDIAGQIVAFLSRGETPDPPRLTRPPLRFAPP